MKKSRKSYRKQSFSLCALLASLLLANINSHADAHLPNLSSLQIHGFLTQAYVMTSHNNWFGDSQDGSLAFTELGINASLQATPYLRLAAQGLSRRAGKMDDGGPRLDYGLLDYQLLSRPEINLGLRIGRLKNPIGLYNSTRDVAATRPTIFLPQSIYFDRVRNLLMSADGAGVYSDIESGRGTLSVDINAGRALLDENVKTSFLGAILPGEMENHDLNLFLRVLYDYDAGRIRLGFTAIDFSMRLDSGLPGLVGDGVIEGKYWLASAEYNTEFWSFAGEYLREPVNFNAFNPIIDSNDGDIESGYLQLQRRLPRNLTATLRYESFYFDRHDRDGKRTSLRTGSPAHAAFMHDWTAGLRWDINSQLLLSAEYHRVNGTALLSLSENPVINNTRQRWDIFALQLSYLF